ncbi:MAG: T9SS type A sorting domain-containing protein [Armatimonadetes bacterium]|nr:T9SS type A sorting domain-containing protein [Armatimonadota bacterium]
MNFGEKFSVIILVMFLISNYLISSNHFLNDYGHIQSSQGEQAFDCFFANGEYLVNIEGKILIENSCFEIHNGLLALTTLEENIPTTLRIYDNSGNLRFEEIFKKAINIDFSENQKFTTFFNGKTVSIINLETFENQNYAGTSVFKIDNNGNPINPSTTISFILTAKDGKNAKLEIYNLKGQKVKQFVSGIRQLPDGQYSVVWSGTNNNDQPVSSGIYFYCLKSGDKQITKKMLLMK